MCKFVRLLPATAMLHPPPSFAACGYGLQAYEVLKPVLMEKEKAENALMSQTQMAWVIIRPGGLSSDPATGTGEEGFGTL